MGILRLVYGFISIDICSVLHPTHSQERRWRWRLSLYVEADNDMETDESYIFESWEVGKQGSRRLHTNRLGLDRVSKRKTLFHHTWNGKAGMKVWLCHRRNSGGEIKSPNNLSMQHAPSANHRQGNYTRNMEQCGLGVYGGLEERITGYNKR